MHHWRKVGWTPLPKYTNAHIVRIYTHTHVSLCIWACTCICVYVMASHEVQLSNAYYPVWESDRGRRLHRSRLLVDSSFSTNV